MFNYVLGKMFKFGKLVSLLFVFISLAIIIISVFIYFTAEKKVKSPVFDDIKNYYEVEHTQENDFKNIKERQEVEKLYSDRIKEIVKNYNFGAENYNIVLDSVISVPEKKRTHFLNSTVKFINKAIEYEKINKKGITPSNMFNMHKEMYFNMLEEEKNNNSQASEVKMYSVGTAIIGLLLFIIFLCIPIIIAIEENTRKS